MNKLKPVFIVLVLIWSVFILNLVLPFNLNAFGIQPRNITGLRGILFSPFLHANIAHISSNTVPFLVLGGMLFLFYERKALEVLVYSALLGGAMVWIFARPATHIGLSGVIYAMASFLIFAGVFSKDFIRVLITIFVIVLYGGLVWGVLPSSYFISWEGHLAGAVSGFFLAKWFYKRPKK